MIPGGNLLAAAFGMIASQPFDYEPFVGRTLNSIGIYENSYSSRVTLAGSIQAVARNVYQLYGLDFQKNYVTVFVSHNVLDISRNTAGDRVYWNGRVFQIVSQTDWYNIDGWVSLLAVDLGAEPAPEPPPEPDPELPPP